MNPNNQKNAFIAFVSCSFNNWKKNMDYLVGTFTLFQSILDNNINVGNAKNRKINYNFILLLVPPKIDSSKGITEEKAVIVTLQFIEEIMKAIKNTPLQDIFFLFIAPYIKNPTEGKHGSGNKIITRYIDTFNKLHIWRLDEFGYKKVIYFDADCIVLNTLKLELLFSCGYFCASPDLVLNDYFNGGLMVVEPNTSTFKDMMKKIYDPAFKSYDGGEQGFINSYFNFKENATFWNLEEEILEIQQDDSKSYSLRNKYIEELKERYIHTHRGVYRLPFKYNAQISIHYVSKYAWFTKFKDSVVAHHMTFPIKPWNFLSFPLFDYSYIWLKHFKNTNFYTFFPISLFIYNLFICVIYFIISFKFNLFEKCKDLIPVRKMNDLFEFQLNYFILKEKQLNNLFNYFFAIFIFYLMPILSIVITAFFTILIYIFYLSFPTFEPHMIWNNLFFTIFLESLIYFKLYEQFFSVITKKIISNKRLQNEEFYNKIIELKDNNFYIYKIIIGGIAIIIGSNSVFLFVYLTYCELFLHIIYLACFGLIGIYYLIFHVFIPFPTQCIVKAIEEKKKEEFR
ncbi:hypothetical protein ABK040_015322 [Willaertia magna]